MISRRKFIAAAAATGIGATGAYAYHANREWSTEYDDALRRTWRPMTTDAEASGLMRELARYAALAPSSHNTQCWRFRVGDRSISILPDLRRRCPAVDPDDHHLFVSLGCATENLVLAAAAAGFHADARFDAGGDGSVDVALSPTKPTLSPLFDAIVHRQSTRAPFDGKPLSNAELGMLQAAGSRPGVRMMLLTDKRAMASVTDFVIRGNTAQMRDKAFVAELKRWLRFNGGDAVRTGDGLFSAASGNPTGPDWFGSLMFDAFFKETSENDKYARQNRSSAGIAVFVSETADKMHWVEVGRAFERFALQATTLGIRTAHLNQPVEVASIRSEFAEAIGVGGYRPDLVIRFGRGPQMPRSLRRPVEAMLA